MKSTLKVILVKFVVSPYSPLAAYFAVALQGTLGYLLFFNGFNNISPIIHGLLSLLFSSIQRVIIMTIVFGTTIWESINVFYEFVVSQLSFISSTIHELNFSYVLIGSYMLLHIVAGFIAGIFASRFPMKYEKENKNLEKDFFKNELGNVSLNGDKKKKKMWWKRPSGILIFTFSIILIILSFTVEQLDSNFGIRIITMLVRSVVIILLWFYFISPLLLKYFNKLLLKKKQESAKEIEIIINLFPSIKSIIKYSWKETETFNGLRRVLRFLDLVLINFLMIENK